MSGKRRKGPREKDLTSRYFSGHYDEDRAQPQERFTDRNKNAEQNRLVKTAQLRADAQTDDASLAALPIGEVIQVYSRYCDVYYEATTYLCVIRKTLNKLAKTAIVVGDQVRFRVTGAIDEKSGRPEAVIEQMLPRTTVLTRTDSFLSHEQHPIVANAEQMLIVASLYNPVVKWGLIDRMIIAAQGGGLVPIICLNKIDLADQHPEAADELKFAREALAHYRTLNVMTLETSATARAGLDQLLVVLRGKVTVLAGHSGVGKSTLIRDIQPELDIRVGEVSAVTAKGRHTTTSARRYALDVGGYVIDTPGVKMFGLWGVTRENLAEFFADVERGTAPDWRRESYERIADSLRSIAER